MLLTETFSTGFAVDDPALGEPEGGPSSQFLQEQAALHGVWVCGSCPEIPADSDPADRRPANSFVLAGPDGTVHRYHKIHPFTFGGEDAHFRAGDRLVQVEIEGVRVSPFVCYDLRFADEFWGLATTTDLYLVPANWPEPRRQHWMALLQARAIENQAYVVGCNRVGEGGGLKYVGDSRVRSASCWPPGRRARPSCSPTSSRPRWPRCATGSGSFPTVAESPRSMRRNCRHSCGPHCAHSVEHRLRHI